MKSVVEETWKVEVNQGKRCSNISVPSVSASFKVYKIILSYFIEYINVDSENGGRKKAWSCAEERRMERVRTCSRTISSKFYQKIGMKINVQEGYTEFEIPQLNIEESVQLEIFTSRANSVSKDPVLLKTRFPLIVRSSNELAENNLRTDQKSKKIELNRGFKGEGERGGSGGRKVEQLDEEWSWFIADQKEEGRERGVGSKFHSSWMWSHPIVFIQSFVLFSVPVVGSKTESLMYRSAIPSYYCHYHFNFETVEKWSSAATTSIRTWIKRERERNFFQVFFLPPLILPLHLTCTFNEPLIHCIRSSRFQKRGAKLIRIISLQRCM